MANYIANIKHSDKELRLATLTFCESKSYTETSADSIQATAHDHCRSESGTASSGSISYTVNEGTVIEVNKLTEEKENIFRSIQEQICRMSIWKRIN